MGWWWYGYRPCLLSILQTAAWLTPNRAASRRVLVDGSSAMASRIPYSASSISSALGLPLFNARGFSEPYSLKSRPHEHTMSDRQCPVPDKVCKYSFNVVHTAVSVWAVKVWWRWVWLWLYDNCSMAHIQKNRKHVALSVLSIIGVCIKKLRKLGKGKWYRRCFMKRRNLEVTWLYQKNYKRETRDLKSYMNGSQELPYTLLEKVTLFIAKEDTNMW